MRERITLSLSPTGTNVAGTTQITGDLLALHRHRARVLRAEAFACYARGVWRWLTGQADQGRTGDCVDRDWLTTPARG